MQGSLILSHQVPEDWRAQADVFGEIFAVFLVIGTLVGVVVVSYTLYHAYRGRDTGESKDDGFEPPVLGELPRGQSGAKSKKLFLSFGISAVIVISLVTYSYFLFQYVETGPTEDVSSDAAPAMNAMAAQSGETPAESDGAAPEMAVEVVGIQFAWQFNYPNGVESLGELRVPQGHLIRLRVTSDDVWHNFGVPDLRVKADSIPGQYQKTWFIADETGSYTANCYELCGRGHSDMTAEVIVMENEAFYDWYESEASSDTGSDGSGSSANATNDSASGSTATAAGRVAGPAGVIAG
jgi:cytochrome c oxidase subunit 2